VIGLPADTRAQRDTSMIDVEQLQADAEEAEIRGEMARSQLIYAKSALAARTERFSQSSFRHNGRLLAATLTVAAHNASDQTPVAGARLCT
jgi:hypothetical protein